MKGSHMVKSKKNVLNHCTLLYMDLEVEETHRAAGRGRNPNAPSAHLGPWEDGVASHGGPSSGPGGEDSSDGQASRAGRPPQGETAGFVGEGRGHLVPARGSCYGGQPRKGPAGEALTNIFFTIYMILLVFSNMISKNCITIICIHTYCNKI